MKQPLAIVGASARAAASSAVRAGFQPVTADLFADTDLRRIATATRIAPYPDGFLDWLRTIEPAAWMYTGALENHPELIDQMAWLAPLWGNPGDVLQRSRSPLELAQALGDAGLLFPETRESPAGLPCDGTWLAKTYRGASGSGVRELTERGRQGEKQTRRPVGEALTTSSPCLPPSLSPPLFFQRRIPGTPAAAVFLAAAGTRQPVQPGAGSAATFLGSTRQLIGEDWLGAHGFQYAGSIGPMPISETALATIKTIGTTLAECFELIGLFGIDFILAGDEVWTLEVNPRYTASVEIIERATGVQALAAHAAACTGSPLPQSEIRNPKSEISNAHGKATLFARQNITITPAFAEWSLSEASRTHWPTLADISPAGTRINAGRPILTLFAAADTADEVQHQLRQRVADIEQKLYAD